MNAFKYFILIVKAKYLLIRSNLNLNYYAVSFKHKVKFLYAGFFVVEAGTLIGAATWVAGLVVVHTIYALAVGEPLIFEQVYNYVTGYTEYKVTTPPHIAAEAALNSMKQLKEADKILYDLPKHKVVPLKSKETTFSWIIKELYKFPFWFVYKLSGGGSKGSTSQNVKSKESKSTTKENKNIKTDSKPNETNIKPSTNVPSWSFFSIKQDGSVAPTTTTAKEKVVEADKFTT